MDKKINPNSLVNLDKGREARKKEEGAVRVNVSLKPSTHAALKKLPPNVSGAIDRLVEWVKSSGKIDEIFFGGNPDTHDRKENPQTEDVASNTHHRIEELEQKLSDTHDRIEDLERNLRYTHDRNQQLETELAEEQARFSTLDLIAEKYRERMDYWQGEAANARAELEEVRSQLCTHPPIQSAELPDPASLLNQLKAKRKKSAVTLADVEAIFGILEELTPQGK